MVSQEHHHLLFLFVGLHSHLLYSIWYWWRVVFQDGPRIL